MPLGLWQGSRAIGYAGIIGGGVDNNHQIGRNAGLGASDRDWLVPSAIMTAGLGVAAVLLMPAAGYTDIPPYFGRFITWLIYAGFAAAFLFCIYVLKLWKSGVASPASHLKARFGETKVAGLVAVAGIALAGADTMFFMWIKPEITAVSPFWADELFANIDRAIFGIDPWRYFAGWNLTFHAWAYSFFWAVALSLTLVWLLARKPSRQRSCSLLAYFALWSVFGTIGQLIGSAAGPIFYRRIGLGDRFAELEQNIPEVTLKLSDYLWQLYSARQPGVGAGISAMPSLHIATAVWIYLVFRGQGSRLAPVAALFAAYMLAMSVALGWHYAIDGIAGALGAFACHWGCRSWMRFRYSNSRRGSGMLPEPESAIAHSDLQPDR
jgi:hypothetical protein